MPSQPPETISAIPMSLHWQGQPAAARVADDMLEITAGPSTDWFADPGTGELNISAPALLGTAGGDFLLAARVEVAFASTYDAGALVLWRDDRTWAKLCFEYSPQGEPMVVSVVTRGVSDDCNSFAVAEGAVWLRVARIGDAHAFHASADGERWLFVRHFRLDGDGPVGFGFEAQSPLGGGCGVTFSHIRYDPATLDDLRDGT